MIAALARHLVHGWGRFLGGLTPPAARALAPSDPGRDFGPLRGSSYCLLVSRRRDGTAVPTPVWFALAGNVIVFRTDAASPKVRRMERDPDVVVAPCSIRGRPLGPAVRARARRIAGPAAELAVEEAIGETYGLRGRIWNRLVRLSGLEAASFELTPAPDERPDPTSLRSSSR